MGHPPLPLLYFIPFSLKVVSHFMGFIYLPGSPRLDSPWGQSLCLPFISTASVQYTTSLTNVLFIHSFITALISTPSRTITSLSLSMPSFPSLKLSLLPLAWNVFYYLFHSSVYFFNFSVTNHCNTSYLWENDPAVSAVFLPTLPHSALFLCVVCNLGLWTHVW